MSIDYVIRESRRDELSALIDFLDEHHMKEDVIAQGFAKKHGNTTVTPVSKSDVIAFMSKYTSLMVVQSHKNVIIGAVVLFPGDDDMKTVKSVGRSQELDEAIIKVYVDSGLYNKYNPKKMIKIRKLGVHRDHRGKGLAKRLIEESCIWAKKNGYEVAYGLFSSGASKRVAEKVGFVKILDYDVRELRDSKGENLLADCSPNNVIALMTKEIR